MFCYLNALSLSLKLQHILKMNEFSTLVFTQFNAENVEIAVFGLL